MEVGDPDAEVQAAVPTLTVVEEPVVTVRPVPVMVKVPPAVDMEVGLTAVTVGMSAGMKIVCTC